MPLLTDPTTIPGCQIWLDATDLTTLFQLSAGGGTTPITASGQPVGFWRDKSGQNRHFASRDNWRPTYESSGINGRPGISTGGSGTMSTWLQSLSAVTATSQTIFMVVRWLIPGARGILYGQSSAFGTDTISGQLNTNWHGIQTNSTSNYYFRLNGTDFTGTTNGAINISSGVFNGHIITAKCTGTTVTYYGDGGYNQGTPVTFSPTAGTYVHTRIGGNDLSNSGLWIGNYCMSEVLMYNRSLSFLEQKNIECYLGEKYGVPYSTYAIKDGNISDGSVFFNDFAPTSRPWGAYIYPNTYTLTITANSARLGLASGNLDSQTTNGGMFVLAPTSSNISLSAIVVDAVGSNTASRPLISIAPGVTATVVNLTGIGLQANRNPVSTGGALISGVNCTINATDTVFYTQNTINRLALQSIMRGVSSTLRFTNCKFTGTGHDTNTILTQGTIVDAINSTVILDNCTMRYDDITDIPYSVGPTINLNNSTLTATNCPLLRQAPSNSQDNAIGFRFDNSTGVFNNCNILGPVNYRHTSTSHAWSNTGPSAILLTNRSNVNINGGTIIGAQQSPSTTGLQDGLNSNNAAVIVSDNLSTLTINNAYIKGGGPPTNTAIVGQHAVYNNGNVVINSCTIEGGGGDGVALWNLGTGSISNSNILGGSFDTATNSLSTLRFINCNFIGTFDGVQPTRGTMLVTPGVNNYIRYASDGTGVGPNAYIFQYTTESLSAFSMPPATAVRAGVTYANNTLVGTCIIPSPSSVALNIPVDNTVGTAILSINDINAMFLTPLSSITVPGSIGAKIKTAATVESAGHLIASFTYG